MLPRCVFDTGIRLMGDDGAEGLWVRGVAETPYIFYLFLGQLKSFGDIDVRGEEFDAGRRYWVG